MEEYNIKLSSNKRRIFRKNLEESLKFKSCLFKLKYAPKINKLLPFNEQTNRISPLNRIIYKPTTNRKYKKQKKNKQKTPKRIAIKSQFILQNVPVAHFATPTRSHTLLPAKQQQNGNETFRGRGGD